MERAKDVEINENCQTRRSNRVLQCSPETSPAHICRLRSDVSLADLIRMRGLMTEGSVKGTSQDGAAFASSPTPSLQNALTTMLPSRYHMGYRDQVSIDETSTIISKIHQTPSARKPRQVVYRLVDLLFCSAVIYNYIGIHTANKEMLAFSASQSIVMEFIEYAEVSQKDVKPWGLDIFNYSHRLLANILLKS
jgi:hypothetical protein